MKTYGLDDVDEIGGPRASMRVLSHMTAWWRDAGIWDRYKADFEERFSEKPHTVRPSPLGMEHYADVYVGQRAKQYIENYDLNQPWCCWVSFLVGPTSRGMRPNPMRACTTHSACLRRGLFRPAFRDVPPVNSITN